MRRGNVPDALARAADESANLIPVGGLVLRVCQSTHLQRRTQKKTSEHTLSLIQASKSLRSSVSFQAGMILWLV